MITDETLIAATIATEVPPFAVGKFTDGMIPLALNAVADCIRNRALAGDAFGRTARAVVLAPKQFSAVLREEYWFKAVLGLWQPSHVEEARQHWRSIVAGPAHAVGDRKILWYYSPISMVPKYSEPSWVKNLIEVPRPGIDRDYFRFYGSK